jgi:hypothetical protein
MGCQAASEDMRSSDLDLHVTTLLSANNPHFIGSPSKGIESVIQRLP